jgi:hypothetical protein
VAGVVVIGLVLAAAVFISRMPRPVSGTATLDECLGGWPVVVFEGEDWRVAMPDDLQAAAPRQIPVAAWPSGMRFDEAAGTLMDANDEVLFRRGDRVRLDGAIVRTTGDPAPCFYTLGVQVEQISAP